VWIILYFAGVFTLTTLNFSRSSDGFPMSSRKLSCYKTYWETYSRINDECGVGGGKCLPFSSDWVVTRCPRNCIGDGLDYPVIGDKYYTASSLVCASAVHAGVIEDAAGGCFKMRFAGEQTFFNGTKKNGVTSHVLGWFPKSMEFAKVENGNACNDISPWVDVFISLGISVLFLVVRVRSSLAVSCLVVTGFLYLVSEDLFTEDAYISRLNAYSPRLFTLFLFCGFTWPIAGRITFPDPRKFPLDALLFYFLPFWVGIHMHKAGIPLTLTSDAFSNPSMALGLILFMVIGGVVVGYQFIQLYKAGKLWKVFTCIGCWCVPVFILMIAYSDNLAFHFHHYMVGMAGFLIFIGQPRSRISIILQALMLGVLVNGVTIYDVDPIFDSLSGTPTVDKNTLYWTGVNTTTTSVSVQFATVDTLRNVWKCSNYITNDEPKGVNGSVNLLSDGAVLPSENPSFTVVLNGVVWYQGFLSPNMDGSYSYTATGLKPNMRIQFSVGNQSLSQVLSVSPFLDTYTYSPSLGGGYYDGNNSTFASNACNRFVALKPGAFSL